MSIQNSELITSNIPDARCAIITGTDKAFGIRRPIHAGYDVGADRPVHAFPAASQFGQRTLGLPCDPHLEGAQGENDGAFRADADEFNL